MHTSAHVLRCARLCVGFLGAHETTAALVHGSGWSERRARHMSGQRPHVQTLGARACARARAANFPRPVGPRPMASQPLIVGGFLALRPRPLGP